MNGTPPPQRSEEELLTLVRTKAAAIRHRRLQLVTGTVAGLVVVAGCLVLASRHDDDGATNVTMASPGTSLSEAGGGAFSPVESLPDAPPETTSTVPGAAPAPAPAGDTPPGGVAPSGPVNQPAPDPAGNQASGGAGIANPAPEPPPTCSPAEMAVIAVTDRPVYPAGSDVHVTVTARNQSLHPCARPTSFSFEFADGSGKMILGGGGHEDWLVAPPPPLQPGETVTQGTTWSGTSICDGSCQPAPPGTYTVTARLGSYTTGPVAFSISG